MIALTRLTGAQLSLNADLIERIEATPDTTITLIDRTRYIVREPVSYVIELIEDYRARVLARSRSVPERPHRPPLEVVASNDEPQTDDQEGETGSVKHFPPARTK